MVDYTLTKRYELSNILRNVLVESIGLENATFIEDGVTKYKTYFQPPETVRLQYPCIIYQVKTGDTEYADNDPYRFTKQYEIIVIDPNPDSVIPYHVAMLRTSRMDRAYTSNNLNHWTFNLYY